MNKESKNEYNRNYLKQLYLWSKEHRICARCHKEHTENGRVLCKNCSEEYKEKYNSRIAERQAKRNAERLKAGLCICCLSPRSENNKYFCVKHRDMKNERERKYRMEKHRA